MNKQCRSCIHGDVCAYKEHYKDVIELYEKAKNECSKYPYFVCDIRCIKYSKSESVIKKSLNYADEDTLMPAT